jgi:hypothetical protein
MSLRPARTTQQVSGQSRLHSEILPSNITKEANKQTKLIKTSKDKPKQVTVRHLIHAT